MSITFCVIRLEFVGSKCVWFVALLATMGDQQFYGLGLGSGGNVPCNSSTLPKVSGITLLVIVFATPPPIATPTSVLNPRGKKIWL